MMKKQVISQNIWLIQTGIVDSNTKRAISPETARGLALKSDYYPIIWVNSKLQPAPKVFTLAHELAHLWIGSEGISDHAEELNIDIVNQIEKLCDEVASEILVPERLLQQKWNEIDSPEDNIEKLYKYFGVSRFVVAKKGLKTHLLDQKNYNLLYK